LKVSQELFVPFINSTESSEFFILYNYAASSTELAAFEDTSPSNWIHKEVEARHFLDGIKEDEKWILVNRQQTGRTNFL
jgi:hypothetical protein